MGEDLGVIGADEPAPDPTATKPELKAVLAVAGKVELQWKKFGFTGIRIEVDRGTGQWVFLDVDTKPHYQDPASPAPGTAVVWKYRAIYLRHRHHRCAGVKRFRKTQPVSHWHGAGGAVNQQNTGKK
jgi:hypothetical protein